MIWTVIGTGIYLTQLLIPIVMLFIIPTDRKPSSATAWLLLIAILPFLGLLIFFLIGNPKLPQRRRALQRTMDDLVAQAIEDVARMPALTALLAPPVPPRYEPHAALNTRLGGMPPFAGNSVELLPEYDAIIARMAEDIERARRFVHIEFYIIAMDRTTECFFSAMESAVQRGVKVRLLLDQIGSRKYPGRKQMLERLTRAGIEWHYMLPVGQPGEWLRPDLRNHRKILVVDGEIAYTGSLNLITRHYHRKDGLYYDELVARVTGPIVAQFEAVFITDWYSETGILLNPRESRDLAIDLHATGDVLCQVLPSGPGHDHENNLKLFTGLIHAARRRIMIANPYFVPDDALLLAIISAAQRGVEVTMLNSEAIDQVFVAKAQRSYYAQLLRAGVKIMLYQSPILLHSKFMVVDDDIAMIGSSNLDIRSFTLNLEVSLMAYDPQIAAQLSAILDTYIERSTPLLLAQWEQRSAGKRLLENIARLTAALQ